MTQAVPSFTGGRLMDVFQPVIRGIDSTCISFGDEPNVTNYIVGIYYSETVA